MRTIAIEFTLTPPAVLGLLRESAGCSLEELKERLGPSSDSADTVRFRVVVSPGDIVVFWKAPDLISGEYWQNERNDYNGPPAIAGVAMSRDWIVGFALRQLIAMTVIRVHLQEMSNGAAVLDLGIV